MDNDKTVNGKRKRAALAVFVLAAVIGAVTLYFYVKYKATHITTDDAFIEGKIHAVAAKIPGTVKAVAVADNRMVSQGELMVEIDPVDYEIRVREASAAVEAEKTKLGEAKARVETVQRQRGELRAIVESAKAQLELHEANFRQAETDLRRAERLYGSQALSRERYEKTKTGYEASLAQVRAAREQVKQAETSLDTNDASIRQAEAAQRTAARSVESGVKRVAAARSSKVLQRKTLEAEQKKYENGMSTSFEVLRIQTDLSNAQLSEIRAVLDYVKSLAELERAKGTLIEARGFQISQVRGSAAQPKGK